MLKRMIHNVSLSFIIASPSLFVSQVISDGGLPAQRDTVPLVQKGGEVNKTSFEVYEKIPSDANAPIRKIHILADGAPINNEDFVRAHIKFTEGDAFNPFAADDAIHSLHAIGIFDDINISATQNPDNSLDVTVGVTMRPKIAKIKFPHEKISNKTLKKQLKTNRGDYLSKSNINEDILSIYRHYQISGFPSPTVTFEIVPTEPGFVEIVFDIVAGKSSNISGIKFHNFGDVDVSAIRKKMMLKTWSIFSFITKKGYFIDVLLDADRQMIVDAMRDAGYLDAKLLSAEFNISSTNAPEGKNAALKMNSKHGQKFNKRACPCGTLDLVAELGQKYFIGKISCEGNTIYTDQKIQDLLKLTPGDAFGPSMIDHAAENVQDFYRYHGYINTFVNVQKSPTFANNAIDIKFIVKESSLFYVNAITINGNYKTKNKVLLRELALAPGDKFNYIKMKNSESRLRNTEFFETVTVDSLDSEIPDHKNIQIDVKEANTGNIKVGGAISARNNQIIFAELSQSNFDLWNPENKFQGGGQKARARVQLGTRESALLLSFEEPYLFDRELAFGVDVFGNQTKYRKSDSNYSGATYDETSIGFEPYFRKRLYELWIGRLAYNFTNFKIDKVSANAVQPLKDETGHRTASSLKFSVERDTRDSYIFPRTGSLIAINSQLSGLGGQTKLFRLGISGGRWFHVSEKYDHTLSLVGSIGSIFPYGHKATPFTERYFLGGGDMMRGFEVREISPKDNRRESLGGNSFCYGCTEYTFNIFDSFFGATFLEAGAVNAKKTDFFKNINVDAGVGLRIFIGNMPLRLDWGYPIHCSKETKKKGVQFNFSFGASF